MRTDCEGGRGWKTRGALLGMLLAAALMEPACLRPHPAEPYDIRRPPFDADVVLRAVDITATVPYLDLELYDPDGDRYTGMTDNTGVLTFDFPDMTRGIWRAFLPAQGRYHDSEVLFEARGGVNEVTFHSEPKLVLSAVSPVTYSYTTQTQVVLQLDYEQGGALKVPVTIMGSPPPLGWDMAHTPFLGRETNRGGVTIAVPPGQYRQPVVDFCGYAKGVTNPYTRTDYLPVSSVTISRGFPVTIFAEFSWTSTVLYGGNCAISGQWAFYQANGANIPWAGTLGVGRPSDASVYFNTSVSFTGSATGSWATVQSLAESGHELVFTVNIHADGFGEYFRSHGSGLAGNVTGSHVVRVPEAVY